MCHIRQEQCSKGPIRTIEMSYDSLQQVLLFVLFWYISYCGLKHHHHWIQAVKSEQEDPLV